MLDDRTATLLARLGFAARGLVYILVGWLAIDAARRGSAPGDNQAAMASLLDQPFGRALLGVVALGLAGYALWRLTEAIADPERLARSARGAFERAGHAVSGIAHVALAIYAAKLATRTGGGGGSAPGDAAARDWTAWLLEHPGGAVLVGLVGAGFLAAAVGQLVKAWQGRFLGTMNGDVPVPDWVCRAGRVGYAARAAVFALIGWFFLMAAWASRPERAGGMGQALRRLQQGDHGAWVLGLVAAGLLVFGAFSLVEARYRRIAVRLPG